MAPVDDRAPERLERRAHRMRGDEAQVSAEHDGVEVAHDLADQRLVDRVPSADDPLAVGHPPVCELERRRGGGMADPARRVAVEDHVVQVLRLGQHLEQPHAVAGHEPLVHDRHTRLGAHLTTLTRRWHLRRICAIQLGAG
jgi:hypothetical protein